MEDSKTPCLEEYYSAMKGITCWYTLHHRWTLMALCFVKEASQNDCHQKKHKQQMLARMWRKGNPHTLSVGM